MTKPLLYKSYLQTIINSVNSEQYKNFYVVDTESNDIIDVLQDGNLSCAVFVSNILHMFSGLTKLINGPHATITSTIKDMQNNGWYETSELKIGAVIHWEKVDFGITGYHEHIGFYVGNNKAVSNDYELGKISLHGHDFDGTRKIEKIFWHDSL